MKHILFRIKVYQISNLTMLKLQKQIKPKGITLSDQKEKMITEKGMKIVRRKPQIRNSLKFNRKSSLHKNVMIDYKKEYREWEGHEIHYIPRPNNQLELSRCTTAQLINPVYYTPKLQTLSTKLSFEQQEKTNNLQSKYNQQSLNVCQNDSPSLYTSNFDLILSYKMKAISLQQALQKLTQENEQLNIKLHFFDQVGQFIMERQAYISQITTEVQNLKIEIDNLLSQEKEMKKELKWLTHELNQQQYFLQQSVANISQQKTQFQTIIKSQLQLSQQIRQAEQRNILKEEHTFNCNNPERKRKLKYPTQQSSFQNNHKEEKAIKSNDYLRTPSNDMNNGQQCTQTDADQTKKISQPSPQSDKHQYGDYNDKQIGILKRKKMNTDKLVHQNHQLRKQNMKLMRKIKTISQKVNSNEFCSDSDLDLSFSPKHYQMK